MCSSDLYCIDNGVEIYYHLRRHQYSSTEIRNRVYNLEQKKREDKEDRAQETVIGQYSPEILEKYSIKNNQS